MTIPQPGEGKRGEQGHLGYLLRQAGVALRARMERALSDLDVTPPQFAALTMLGSYPGLSNADLARLTLLTPQTLSVIVANLKRSGAVESRPHQIHGRIQELFLTTSGKALLKRCKTRVAKVEQAMVDGLSRPDEEIIRRWLVQVAQAGGDAG